MARSSTPPHNPDLPPGPGTPASGPITDNPFMPLPVSFSSAYIGSHQPSPSERLKIRDGAYVAPLDATLPAWQLKAQVTYARCQAALHCSRTDAVLARESAAFVHGLPLWEQEPDIVTLQRSRPHRPRYRYPVVDYPRTPVTCPGNGSPAPSRPGRRVLHRRLMLEVPAEETLVLNGLRVTSLERTVTDCARYLHPRDALVVVDAYLRRRCLAAAGDSTDSAAFQQEDARARAELLARLQDCGRARGVRRARTIVSIGSARAESPLESALRWVVLQAGFPEPALQVTVFARHGRYRVDLAWPALKVFVEADGLVKYSTQDGRTLAQEKIREDDLRRLGTVLRFIWREVALVDPVVEALRRVMPDDVVASLHPVPGLQP